MFNPWRALRDKTHINLTWRIMPTRLGETNGSDMIRLHPWQSQVQRRSTLTHELAHIELEHTAGCHPKDEAAARQWAARKLVPMSRLMNALRWADDLHTVADELWVTEKVLLDRLDGLTPAEKQQLIDLHNSIEKGA